MAKRMFEYRIYPSIKQVNRLKKQFFLAKKLYNLLLLITQDQYRANGEHMSTYDRNKAITRIKELDPEFDDCHSQVLQNISNRIGKAYSNFFRRLRERKKGKKVKVGFPRFKKYLKTVTYPQSGFKFVSDRLLYIGKVGNVPIKKHRPTIGKVKTMSVKWTRSDKWFVVFCCETPDPPEVPTLLEQTESQGQRREFKNEVGIDLGLEKFLATSDNMIVENPRFLKKEGKQLKKLQRRLSRKT